MPLPSQSARMSSGGGGRSSMYRRKRNGLGPVLVGGAVIVAAGLAVWAILPAGQKDRLVKPSGANASPPPVAKNDAKTDLKIDPKTETKTPPAPSTVQTPPVAPPKPAPLVEIGQGSAGGVKRASDAEPKATPPQNPPQINPAPKKEEPPVAPPPAVRSPQLSPSLRAAKQREDSGDLVAARLLYSRALADGKLMPSEQNAVREVLTTEAEL